MNFTKAKTYLDKINLLYQGIQDDDQLSPIERKLMLDYISKLYDCFWYKEQSNNTPASISIPRVKTPTTTTSAQVVATPAPAPNPAPEIVETPITQQTYTAPETVSASVPEETSSAKKFDFQLPKARVSPTTFNTTFNELFEQEATRDLSQKLGERPISNLKLAWGVGDKFLIINELFGKNSSAFDEAIEALDGLGSMDEARAYLEKNIITKNNWTDENKVSTAKNFIKTIKRRYL